MTVFATITDLVSGNIYALRREGPAGSNVKFLWGFRLTSFALVTIVNYSRSWLTLTVTIDKVD